MPGDGPLNRSRDVKQCQQLMLHTGQAQVYLSQSHNKVLQLKCTMLLECYVAAMNRTEFDFARHSFAELLTNLSGQTMIRLNTLDSRGLICIHIVYTYSI